jgi:uncharacterized phiE125 gp8 family phage protein
MIWNMSSTSTAWATNDIDFDSTKISEPAVEPLDVEFVKLQRKAGSSTAQDLLYDLWIAAARNHFESMTGWQCIDCVWEDRFDAFPVQNQIQLSRPPLREVDSVTYLDADGVEQTFDSDSYRVITSTQGLGSIALVSSSGSWPTITESPKGVKVRYTAGFGAAPGAVPELVRYALLMLIGHFDKFREEMHEATNTLHRLEFGAQFIIQDYINRSRRTIVPKRQWLG